MCALRALNLCGITEGLGFGDRAPCYCSEIDQAVRLDLEQVASDLRWARAVEVARAQRDPEYVRRCEFWVDLARRRGADGTPF